MIQKLAHLCLKPVALRKESVDRNACPAPFRHRVFMSLSARRAWIEMLGKMSSQPIAVMSLSARRAWIEMD